MLANIDNKMFHIYTSLTKNYLQRICYHFGFYYLFINYGIFGSYIWNKMLDLLMEDIIFILNEHQKHFQQLCLHFLWIITVQSL